MDYRMYSGGAPAGENVVEIIKKHLEEQHQIKVDKLVLDFVGFEGAAGTKIVPCRPGNIGGFGWNFGCSSFVNIYYKGTEEQWNAIIKDTDWNINMGSNVEGGTVITYNFTY